MNQHERDSRATGKGGEGVHDLVGAYLLNAVDDQERAAFEDHLPGCVRCQEELRELSPVVDDLSADLSEPPPPELRSRLLARIGQEPQDAAAPSGGELDDARHRRPADDAPRGGIPRGDAPHDDLAARRRSRPGRRWLTAVAAAAAVAVGAVVITQVVDDEPDQVVATVQDVLEAPDATRSTERLEQAELTVVTSASLDRAVLVADGLAAAPQGEVYQMWFLQEDETVVSAGLVPEAAAGSQTVLLEGDPAGAIAVALSLEPAGGSDQPTSDPLVAVPLQP